MVDKNLLGKTALLALTTAIAISFATPSDAQMGSSGSSAPRTGASNNTNNNIGNVNRNDGTSALNPGIANPGIGTPGATGTRSAANGAVTGGVRTDFTNLDADRNGSISTREFRATGRSDSQTFVNLDIDRDGRLSATELDNFRAGSSLRTTQNGWLDFNGLDNNRNGRLTQSEFVNRRLERSLFPSIDANRDGFLSQAEVDGYSGSQAQGRGDAWVDFNRLDNDRNGRLTSQEFSATTLRTDSLFGSIDTDRNGSISQTEMNAYAGTR